MRDCALDISLHSLAEQLLRCCCELALARGEDGVEGTGSALKVLDEVLPAGRQGGTQTGRWAGRQVDRRQEDNWVQATMNAANRMHSSTDPRWK